MRVVGANLVTDNDHEVLLEKINKNNNTIWTRLIALWSKPIDAFAVVIDASNLSF